MQQLKLRAMASPPWIVTRRVLGLGGGLSGERNRSNWHTRGRGFEEKKIGVKGVGRKTTDESEHITWRDGVKVPCGKLVPSRNKDGPLEYNEYAVYDPKHVSICFLVGVKYEEQNMEVVPDDE